MIIFFIVLVCLFLYIIYLLKIIIMNQKELQEKLSTIAEQLLKALQEIRTALENAGNTTPEVDAALNKASEAAQALDDLNPDA